MKKNALFLFSKSSLCWRLEVQHHSMFSFQKAIFYTLWFTGTQDKKILWRTSMYDSEIQCCTIFLDDAAFCESILHPLSSQFLIVPGDTPCRCTCNFKQNAAPWLIQQVNEWQGRKSEWYKWRTVCYNLGKHLFGVQLLHPPSSKGFQ